MDLTLTEDQELIVSTARELLAARAGTAGARAMEDDPAGYSAGLWKEMVELGWTGLALPEEHGGVGGDFLEVCLLFEQLGYALVPSPLLPTVACCALPIARYGTPAQQAEWLGSIARGRVMSHTPVPWDRPPGEGPWATATGTGDVEIDGTALFVPYAHAAESLLVVADLEEEPRAFLVDADAPGVTPEPVAGVGLDRPHRVEFAGVRVPGDRLLGADRAAVDAISLYGAAATCAEMVGAAQRVLDMTVEYATGREQFGRPIGSFQAVQHHCADMAIDVLGSRFLAFEAIWRLAAERDAAEEVSMAKAWVSEAYERVCALGHQVHGAIGFTQEHDLHLFSRHAMASALAFGDEDLHYERVAGRLGLPGNPTNRP
ncbi:acyl-CoA dehydrogenase family protein [Actinomadura viridis]|uniref:acyl-CoA dehydrogenase family protein n=1 Tax=Actinomadura viridis TaxID=58110 RepID=UPI0036A07D59